MASESMLEHSTPDLAAQFEKQLNAFFTNAITRRSRNPGLLAGLVLDSLHVFAGSNIAGAIWGISGSSREQLQKGSQDEARNQTSSNLLDSLQLGVEKSQINGSLADQLSALQALKAGIQKQIAAGVDVKNAQHQLVAVEGQIADLQSQIKTEHFANIISSLQLGVDKASLTKGLEDDVKALEALRDGLRAQIKAGVDVANNQSQLVSVLGQIASKQDEIAQSAKDAVKASAFRQIGLSATGGEIIPGISNLKKQLAQLNSSDLSNVPKKLANRLAGVGKVLSDPIKASIPEVRSAIKDLFSAIRDELNKQSSSGPLTKTTSLNTNKILKGLGLDPASCQGASLEALQVQ